MYSKFSDWSTKHYPQELKSIKGIVFTEREIDVIAGILSGKSAATISTYLNISTKTVETHIRNIMLKLGCNSRERIITFIEQAGVFKAFYQHYQHLLLEYVFLFQLKKIARSIRKQNIQYTIYLKINEENIIAVKNYISFYLQQAEIATTIIEQPLEGQKIHESNSFVIIIANDDDILDHQANIINLKQQESYYHLILAILKQIITTNDIHNISNEFLQQYEAYKKGLTPLTLSSEPKVNYYIPKTKFLRLLIVFIMLAIIGTTTGFIYWQYFASSQIKSSSYKTKQAIYSDLIIPTQATFLERPEIIKKMEDNLNGTDGIKTIALVGIIGIGGAGKTTLARYYARFKTNAPIVFEINAENKDTLINSFHSLAYVLASTGEQQKELAFIQQIQNPQIKEQQLLNFVKSNLKEKSEWVLIYDNIESFANINHLLPNDPMQWGNGKVIITTRNEHILEFSHVKTEKIIHISELSNEEMLTLFVKILYDTTPKKLSQNEQEKIITFLKDIPPFPLDVSLAAYSIKNTHIAFEQYIDHVHEYSKNYEALQIKLLHEVTDYSKTRYGIISSTIEKLKNMHLDFKELLLFVCVLDSQNIPYKLLESYKGAIVIEDFIYNLRQNGLVLKESYSGAAVENQMISLHRSTQEIAAAFLINSLTTQEKELFINNVISAVNNFYNTRKKKQFSKNIILLIPHINALLNNLNNYNITYKIRNKYEIDLYIILGSIYYNSINNLALGRDAFQKVLARVSDGSHISTQTLAMLLKDLGAICTVMNYIEEALEYCTKSIYLCKTLPGSELILAENYQIMGAAYRKNNNFDRANEALNKALQVTEKLDDEATKNLKAEIYSQLGHLYSSNFINKKEALTAEKYDYKAVEILAGQELLLGVPIKPLLQNLSCAVARHLWKYGELFMIYYLDYDRAYHHLLNAEYIMYKKCPANMHLKGRIEGLLSKVFLRKNNLIEAERRMTEAVNILNIAVGPNACWVEKVAKAEIKIRLSKFNEAYEECMQIYSQNNIREKNNLHDLRYGKALYHGAFAKFKMGEYQKSLEHFAEFMCHIEKFSKNFLDKEVYNKLAIDGVFAITPNNSNNRIADINAYLQHSLKIFTAIYGNTHPFVIDYIAKNIIE